MSFIAIGATVVSAGATAYGAILSKEAGDAAAQVDTATATYNARYDESMAAQLDLDTLQNIDTERQNDKVYMSRMAAGYASAGVLATSGSALDTQITNAGRFEQKIQQQYVDSQQQQEQYYAAAKVGMLQGAAQAQADRLTGSIALVNGAAKIAGQVYSDDEGGAFNFVKSTSVPDTSMSYAASDDYVANEGMNP